MTRYLVTSALPYANGPIHFGHVAGAYLPADIYARWLRMKGEEVLHVCGTDEHGVAITLRADQEGKSYRDYVDHWHEDITAFFERFRISFDAWSGTARCGVHAETSQKFFSNLLEKGFVHERTASQWFSETLDRFLPDRYLQGGCPECSHPEARGDECPACGAWIDANQLTDPVCTIDGSKPVLRKTLHWYLDLPALQEAGLAAWYEGTDAQHPHRAWKPNVAGHVASMLKELKERPITRDLPWGVPLPAGLEGAEGKVLYVWFDAPIGYLSATMEWAEAQGEPDAWKVWWQDPESRLVHFIGKDNIAFHTVVFPSMLLGQGDSWEGKEFILPWAVPANEFYNLQGRKFSTSKGWRLDSTAFFETYSTDAARFHLLMTLPETADSEFTWEGFQATNNSLLADKLGNFASRVLKFAAKSFEGKAPSSEGGLDSHPSLAEADAALEEIGVRIENFEFRAAAQALMKGCDALNTFFDDQAPWKLTKGDASDRALCGEVVERCLAYLELLSRRMSPFCPDSATSLRTMLGNAAAGSGKDWGPESDNQPPARATTGAILGEAGILFRKIENDAIQEEISRLEDAVS